MSQTLAIFLDAYRELNARKLFWLSMVISLLVVVAFGLVGLTETGLRIVIWDLDLRFLNSKFIKPEVFYKGMFVNFGIGFWLSWLATILALVSTASIFPELITSGSIDLMLSKPIGRLRLFLTKFASGLLFVGLQVTVFSVACFLVIGWRGGVWEPAILLAIPIVLCFFSYLFSFMTLLGLITRSTIAALLLTILFWLLVFGLHAAESVILMGRLGAEMRVESVQKDVAKLEAASTAETQPDMASTEAARQRSSDLQEKLAEALASQSSWRRSHGILFVVKTVLPKTSETIDLLERTLIDTADLPNPEPDEEETQAMAFGDRSGRIDGQRLQKQLIEETRGRSVWWVLGTSLAFEAVVLAIGAWIFGRRDF
jgi:ABC-type transport system involved in multi-copper enzyme maturation permease subunit